MNFQKRRAVAAGIAAAALTAGTVAAVQPASALTINNYGWIEGTVGFNQKQYCLDLLNCYSYSTAMNNVNFQGPIGNENAVPKVGERFYIHVWTAALDSPFDVITDNYQMKLLLPAGPRPRKSRPIAAVPSVIRTSTNRSVLASGSDRWMWP